jgi:hypothetical protein
LQSRLKPANSIKEVPVNINIKVRNDREKETQVVINGEERIGEFL